MSITNLNFYRDLLATRGIFEGTNVDQLVVRRPALGTNLLICNTVNNTVNINGTLNVSGGISVSGLTTDGIPEGSTNLYYTNARARAAISVSDSLANLGYSSSTGVISLVSSPTFSNLNVSGLTSGRLVSTGSGGLLQSLGSGTSSQVLKGNLSWSSVNLTTDISGVLPLNAGGTNANLSTVITGSVVFCNGTNLGYTAVGTSGQLLQSAATGTPTWTSTLNSTIQTNITQLGVITSGTWGAAVISTTYGGTNQNLSGSNNGGIVYKASTGLLVCTNALTGRILQANGTSAPSFSTCAYPSTAVITSTILRSDGTSWVQSTSTFADSYTASSILYSNGANNVVGLTTANNGILATGATGIPVITTVLPSAVQGNITTLGTITGNLSVNGNLLITGETINSIANDVRFGDRYLFVNATYTTNTGLETGMIFNYLPTNTTSALASSFVAGVNGVSNPQVGTVGSGLFAAGDLILITDSTSNDGIFEVSTNVGTTLVIRGIGTVATTVSFVSSQFVSEVAVGNVRKIGVSCLRCATNGILGVATGNSTTGMNFSNVLLSAPYVNPTNVIITANSTTPTLQLSGDAGGSLLNSMLLLNTNTASGSGSVIKVCNSNNTGSFTFNGLSWYRGGSGYNNLCTLSSYNSNFYVGGTEAANTNCCGIFDADPRSNLSVVGNAQIGFASGTTAPSNGLIVSGNTSIGSSSATSLFNVGSSNQFQVNSSGIITSGQYQATVITGTYGGTGVNNSTRTITTSTGSAGRVLASDASGNALYSSTTYPTTAGTAGTILRSDGTNLVNSTSTFADTYSAGALLYSNGANNVIGLVGFDGQVLSNSGGNPSWSSSLSSLVQANITQVGTISSGIWNGSVIPMANGGTNNNITPVAGGIVYSDASKLVLTGAGTAGQILQSNGAGAPSWITPASGGVSSLTGTANQITASASTGAVNLSLPSAVHVSNVSYGNSIFNKASTGNTVNRIMLSNNNVVILSNYNANQLTIYQNGLSGGPTTSSTLATGIAPFGLALSPDGQYLYVALFGATTCTVFKNPTTNPTPLVNLVITTSTSNRKVCFSPNGRMAYVCNNNSQVMVGIENAASDSPSVAGNLATQPGPWGMAFSPNGNRLFRVDNQNSIGATVGRLTCYTNASDSWASLTQVAVLTVGREPRNIAITPDGRYAYITHNFSGIVMQIGGVDTNSPFVNTTLTVGANAYDVAITADGNYVYVSNTGANSISVIVNAQTATPSVGFTITTGLTTPYSLALTPDQQFLYVSGFDNNTVRVLSDPRVPSTMAVITTYTLATQCTEIIVAPYGIQSSNNQQTIRGAIGINDPNPTADLSVNGVAQINGNLVVGNAVRSTSTRNGFIYQPTCAGRPTGVPVSYTGGAAMIYDTSSNNQYTYNGSWTSMMPTGAIIAFGSQSNIPNGFLICEGAAVSRTTFAALFAVIGITHGQGDGSTTFNVPDYRGRFLRGRANASTNDPDRASRTAMNTGGATADNVGSVQTSQFGSHTHSASPSPFLFYGGGGGVGLTTGGSYQGPNTALTLTSSGGNETRPVNAYVVYIIKT